VRVMAGRFKLTGPSGTCGESLTPSFRQRWRQRFSERHQLPSIARRRSFPQQHPRRLVLAEQPLPRAGDSDNGLGSDCNRCPAVVAPALRCGRWQAMMTDPVLIAQTGHTYERTAIERWLREHLPATDPMFAHRDPARCPCIHFLPRLAPFLTLFL
jgi:hypothetical protein